MRNEGIRRLAVALRTAKPVDATARSGTSVRNANAFKLGRTVESRTSLGTTPLYKLSLPAGTHVLTLENPDQGIKQTYTVTIKSGENFSRWCNRARFRRGMS